MVDVRLSPRFIVRVPVTRPTTVTPTTPTTPTTPIPQRCPANINKYVTRMGENVRVEWEMPTEAGYVHMVSKVQAGVHTTYIPIPASKSFCTFVITVRGRQVASSIRSTSVKHIHKLHTYVSYCWADYLELTHLYRPLANDQWLKIYNLFHQCTQVAFEPFETVQKFLSDLNQFYTLTACQKHV